MGLSKFGCFGGGKIKLGEKRREKAWMKKEDGGGGQLGRTFFIWSLEKEALYGSIVEKEALYGSIVEKEALYGSTVIINHPGPSQFLNLTYTPQ